MGSGSCVGDRGHVAAAVELVEVRELVGEVRPHAGRRGHARAPQALDGGTEVRLLVRQVGQGDRAETLELRGLLDAGLLGLVGDLLGLVASRGEQLVGLGDRGGGDLVGVRVAAASRAAASALASARSWSALLAAISRSRAAACEFAETKGVVVSSVSNMCSPCGVWAVRVPRTLPVAGRDQCVADDRRLGEKSAKIGRTAFSTPAGRPRRGRPRPRPARTGGTDRRRAGGRARSGGWCSCRRCTPRSSRCRRAAGSPPGRCADRRG